MKPQKKDWERMDESGASGARAFTQRTGWEPVVTASPSVLLADIPFSQFLAGVKDPEQMAAEAAEAAIAASEGREKRAVESTIGAYELGWMMRGAVALLDYCGRKSLHPADILRQLCAAGRAAGRAPWSELTMHEAAMMEAQSAAAHSWRCKVLSGEIKLAGMSGSRLPGQKSAAASASYREQRKGNTNRKAGKRIHGRKVVGRREKESGGSSQGSEQSI